MFRSSREPFDGILHNRFHHIHLICGHNPPYGVSSALLRKEALVKTRIVVSAAYGERLVVTCNHGECDALRLPRRCPLVKGGQRFLDVAGTGPRLNMDAFALRFDAVAVMSLNQR